MTPATPVPAARRPRWRRRIAAALLALLLVLLAISAWFYAAAQRALPQLDGSVFLPGLGGRVTVVRDAHGVPHISAGSLPDLLFAQGYVTAQDRLWQMDATRRFAAGELSEVLGKGFLRVDRQQRILQIRVVAERLAGSLSAAERAELESYARGVNAYIQTHGDRLPLEFRVLRYKPRPWTVEDSLLVTLSMSEALNHGPYRTELAREAVLAKLGPELTADLYPSTSFRDHPPAAPVVADASHPPSARAGAATTQIPSEFLSALTNAEVSQDPLPPGSNNWVVSGAHTVTGKPLLSNDMHLPHQIPGVWYEAHLTLRGPGASAPELEVAGVTLPGVPYVIAGHNARIAWGYTSLMPDVEDVYLEQFNAQGEYLTPEGWKKPERRREVIRVRSAPDETLEVVVTRHGPIITDLVPGETRKLALQWTLYGADSIHASFLALNRAGNWQEFRQALSSFVTPPLNVVYADVDGHIGYQAVGRLPIRATGDGTLPVPGEDNRHEWTGYVPFEALPSVFDPPSGILATANGRITPDGYPYVLATQWGSPYRTERIYQLLESRKKFTAADMPAVQTDVYSGFDRFCAERFAAAVGRNPGASLRARQAGGLLRAWDGRLTVDSPAATLVTRARRNLWRLLLQPRLGSSDERDVIPPAVAVTGWRQYNWFLSSVALESILTDQPPRWLPPGFSSYDQLLTAAVEATVSEPQAPRDLVRWRYGDQYPLEFNHPIFGRIPVLSRWTGPGLRPQSGGGTTVKQVGRSFGPSQRMTVNLSNLDASTLNLVTGQSGQLGSPYYMDHFPAWYEGWSFPLPFSAAAVEKSRAHTLLLEPAK
ncbi:MAG: penicillin acylase family protein [Terriglobales bacterium]